MALTGLCRMSLSCCLQAGVSECLSWDLRNIKSPSSLWLLTGQDIKLTWLRGVIYRTDEYGGQITTLFKKVSIKSTKMYTQSLDCQLKLNWVKKNPGALSQSGRIKQCFCKYILILYLLYTSSAQNYLCQQKQTKRNCCLVWILYTSKVWIYNSKLEFQWYMK